MYLILCVEVLFQNCAIESHYSLSMFLYMVNSDPTCIGERKEIKI